MDIEKLHAAIRRLPSTDHLVLSTTYEDAEKARSAWCFICKFEIKRRYKIKLHKSILAELEAL